MAGNEIEESDKPLSEDDQSFINLIAATAINQEKEKRKLVNTLSFVAANDIEQ